MSEIFLPWWLVLLLVMWATAVTAWYHPRVHREVRLWAGMSTLLYLGLIFWVIGASSASKAVTPSIIARSPLIDIGFVVCAIVSLTTSTWLVGHVSPSSRRLGYVACTLANSSAAAVMSAPEIAIGLSIVAVLAARPLALEWWRTKADRTMSQRLQELARFAEEPVAREKAGEIGLAWILGGILTCLLLGSFVYSLKVETSSHAADGRQTALPSRAELKRLHSGSRPSDRNSPLLSVAFGERADLVVLLAVIVFLGLAMTRNDEGRQTGAQPSIGHADSSDQKSESTVETIA